MPNRPLLPAAPPPRYHGKALLVTFETSDSSASSHVDALTREIQMSFKRLDGEIRSMDQGEQRGEDSQVRVGDWVCHG